MYKALIIDDLETHRLLLQLELERKNFSVIEAATGKKGIELAVKERPDIVLLDVNMPNLSGYDVIAELTRNFETKDIPIIVVSAADESKNMERCLDLGAFDYVTKPLDLVVLNARLRSALRFREQQKKLEEIYFQLEKTNDKLEEAVEERTLQLKASMEKAEAASKAKTLFIANLSHEFRTPIHGITNYTDIAIADLKEGDLEDLEDCLHKVDHCATRIRELIENLLKITKGEMKTADYEYQPVHTENLLENTLRLIEPVCIHKNISIKASGLEGQGENDGHQIVGDQSALTQVFQNLLDNAVKFSQPGGEIEIELSEKIGATKEGEAAVCIAIADRGIGLNEEDLEVIFDPFIQGSNKDSGLAGSGLGLAIAKQIIDAHQGKIMVQRRAGGGSIFTVSLPLARFDRDIEISA